MLVTQAVMLRAVRAHTVIEGIQLFYAKLFTSIITRKLVNVLIQHVGLTGG